jgi:pimeloyl-ACP methyl ester carboxylesterase
MLGRSFSEYVFIRGAVFFLQHSIEFYILGLAFAWKFAKSDRYSPKTWTVWFAEEACHLLGALLIADVLFLLLLYLPFKVRMQQTAKYPRPSSMRDRHTLFQKCLNNLPLLEEYIRQWFLGVELSEIREGNLREFLLWAFFDNDGKTALRSEEEKQLAMFVREVQIQLSQSDKRLAAGRGAVNCLRLTIDPVETRFRGVLWFSIIAIVDAITFCSLRWNGFRYGGSAIKQRLAVFPPRPLGLPPFAGGHDLCPSGIGYWYRPHTAKNSLPVVFLHGIGIGLWPYKQFLADIGRSGPKGSDIDGDVGVIALEFMPISSRLTAEPLTRERFVEEITRIVNHHGWDRFTLMTHSYGSVLSTHMIHSPELNPRMASLVLIDPVNLMLHLPDIAYNFTRRMPTMANEWQLWYFASMDPGTARTLGRHFFWRDNILWKEELLSFEGEDGESHNRDAVVSLSGLDTITKVDDVLSYLAIKRDFAAMDAADYDEYLRVAMERDLPQDEQNWGSGEEGVRLASGVEVLFFPKLDHAQVFDYPDACGRLLAVVNRVCRSAADR